jgi:epsilon-lactone hydrolase
MLSKQARLLNFLLKYTLKPAIHYYSNQFLLTQDVKIIYRLRKLVNYFPLFIPAHANIKQLRINGVSVTEVSAKKNTSSTLIYLHGGAYVLGSARTYLGLAYRLALACSAKVLLVDYSLAPEKKFPAALEDVLKVYKAIIGMQKTARSLFIAGDSSGGGLTLSTLVALRDKQMPLPTAAVCLSPWTDLALTGASLHTNNLKDSFLSMPLFQIYTNEQDQCNPLASPLYADLKGLPPLLIQVSSTEVLFDDAKHFYDKAIQAGVKATLEVWEQLPHVWHLFAKFLPEGVAAIQSIERFINAQRTQITK